ncbi:MAG: hypothetical protein FWF80_08655 [Defluviitaleaceae bacterium]|nr:hypothetical protein [Defluviitaleaceae bacterium]
MNALMAGLDSEMAREKLKELENQKQALTETLRTLERSADKEINREELIALLNKDTEAFINEPERTREIVQKYVSKITLSDTTVEITDMSDKYVSNSTCGGTQYLLFTLWFSDENGCRVISQTAITIQNPIVPICKGNID